MFNEIAVVVHRKLLDDRCFLAFDLACFPSIIFCHTLSAHIAYINDMGGFLPVHTLADNNDVGGYPGATESLVVHTESTHEVRTALVHNPVTEFLAVVKRTVGRNEDAQTALAQFTHILCYTEIMYVVEFLRQVFVTGGVIHTESGNERNIGNSQIHTAVRYAGLFKALYFHFGIRIEEREDASRSSVNLYGMDVTTLTDVCRHLSQDIADTGRTFKNVSTIEAHLFGNVPKRIHNVCRSVIGTICTHYGLLICLFTKQLTELLCNGIRSIRCTFVESLAQATPATELAKGLHLFFCSLFAAFKQLFCQFDSLDIGFDTGIY